MITSREALESLAKLGGLLPQEEMLEVARKEQHLYIGIPKETSFQETRVALTPKAVALLVNNGHRVVIETNAGKGSHFQDNDYSESGAQIMHDTKEVYKADIILKVGPPSLEEINMMQHKQTLISALQLSIQARNYIKQLMDKKITAIAWDYIMDEENIFPIVRAMGEIAGNTSILIAAEYLSNVHGGQGLMLGGISGIPPTDVVILGAGTVGEYATRAALGLGASVKVFDNSIYRLRRLQNSINHRVFTSIIQPNELINALHTADIVIGAIRSSKGRTPCVVTEEMIKKMKTDSVIVDVSIDQGGCFETSKVTNHSKPIYRTHGVIHYCVPNIPSRVARTASHALSNIFAPIILNIGEKGGVSNVIKRNAGVRNGVYLFNGVLTNEYLGKIFKLPFKDINLLLAAF